MRDEHKKEENNSKSSPHLHNKNNGTNLYLEFLLESVHLPQKFVRRIRSAESLFETDYRL